MLRPIDTQILYPQSPELSNRQHIANQQASLQQNQFADIMQKQAQEKKERVNKTPEKEKVDNELDKNKQSRNKENQNSHKKGQSKEEANKETNKETNKENLRTQLAEPKVKIDIRV